MNTLTLVRQTPRDPCYLADARFRIRQQVKHMSDKEVGDALMTTCAKYGGPGGLEMRFGELALQLCYEPDVCRQINIPYQNLSGDHMYKIYLMLALEDAVSRPGQAYV
jgi:hypothetical protein